MSFSPEPGVPRHRPGPRPNNTSAGTPETAPARECGLPCRFRRVRSRASNSVRSGPASRPAASATSRSIPKTAASGTWPWPPAASGRRPIAASPGSRSSTTTARTRSAVSPSTPRTPTFSGSAPARTSRSARSVWRWCLQERPTAATWKNVGLKHTRAHREDPGRPRDSNTVFVASQGRLEGRRRPRSLQDRGWGQDLEFGARDQREHRRYRSLYGPARPDRPLRGDLPAASQRGVLIGGGPSRPFTRRAAARRGRNSPRGFPKRTWAASRWPSPPETGCGLRPRADRHRQGPRRLLPLRGRRQDLGPPRQRAVQDGQYYGEIIADPHAFDRLFIMDITVQVTSDGGKTFER